MHRNCVAAEATKIGSLWKGINPLGARGGGPAGPNFIAFGAFYGKHLRIDRVGTTRTKVEGYLNTVPPSLVGFRVHHFD